MHLVRKSYENIIFVVFQRFTFEKIFITLLDVKYEIEIWIC
jgi:hypothetical protein